MSDKKNSVVVAIVTFYKSPEELRFRLACQTITSAVAAGHAVVVVDGSPNQEVKAKFTELGAKVFPELHRGLGPSKRQSYFHAVEICNRESYAGVLADEAEKDLAQFVPEILRPLEEHDDGAVIVPYRTTQGWKSYPLFQQESEQAANEVFEKVTKEQFIDIFFGPVFFTPGAAKHFVVQQPASLGFPNTYAQHLGVMLALADGKCEVGTIPIDFVYPPEQLVEEEGTLNDAMKAKRSDQFKTLTDGYRAAGKILFGYEG